MRCQALAQQLNAHKVEVCFAIREQSHDVVASRQGWIGDVLTLPNALGLSEEPEWIAEQHRQGNFDILVLDGYQFDLSYRNKVVDLPFFLVNFDDQNALASLPGDVVINGSDNADALGYDKTAPDAIKCLGSRFRVMRKEFIEEPKSTIERSEQLCIVFGGSDPLGLTLLVLKSLDIRQFSGRIHVLTGAAYAQKEELREFLGNTHLKIKHINDCQHVATEFRYARLSLSAAGGSQFELLACACPSVLVVIADNQLNATQQAQKQGWCLAIDGRKEVDVEHMVETVMGLWHSTNKLLEMESKAKQQVVFDGAANVASSLINLVRQRGT